MSLSPTPTIYFSGINYNPIFYQQPSGVSLTYVSQNYLQRLGANPTSIATNTTFNGNIDIMNDGDINLHNMSSITIDDPGIIFVGTGFPYQISMYQGKISGNSLAITDGSIFSGNIDVNNNADVNLHGLSSLILDNDGSITVGNSNPYQVSLANGQINCNSLFSETGAFYGSVNINPSNAGLRSTLRLYGNTNLTLDSGNFSIGGAINCAVINASGNVLISNTTASSSYTTGSLVVSGGVGIAKDVNTNGNINSSGILNITNNSQSYDNLSGAIITAGGIGVGKDLCVYGNILAYTRTDINGTFHVNDTTQSTSYTTGSAIFQGGIGIYKDINTNGNITSNGNIIVNSTTLANTRFPVAGSIITYGGILSYGNYINASSIISRDYHSGAVILTGSSGMGVGGDVNINGNLSSAAETILYDGGVNNNFAVSGTLCVGGKIVSGSQISCDSLLTNTIISTSNIQYDNKIVGYIYSNAFPYSYPLTRSIYNTLYNNGINLTNILLLTYTPAIWIQPKYKVIISDTANAVLTTIDNTNGVQPLYSVLSTPNGYADYNQTLAIVLYFNGIQINP